MDVTFSVCEPISDGDGDGCTPHTYSQTHIRDGEDEETWTAAAAEGQQGEAIQVA